MNKIFATILTIGDELLIGQVIDTNSAWIAQRLNSIGVIVKRRISVGDVYGDIWEALDNASTDTQVILITGGLGPTADDITKPLLCDYFGGTLVVDPGAMENVTQIFARLNRPMIARNLKQAEVPDVCKVIQNKRGTAPGMVFERNGNIYISMPGVPHEMKGMVDDFVLGFTRQRFELPSIIHRTLLTAGVGESFLADLIEEWELALPEAIKLAYLPNFGMVRLRLTAIGFDAEKLSEQVLGEFERLKVLVQAYLVTDEDLPMEAVVAKLLKERNQTMATAESCTGGYIAHLITAMPGSSTYYKGSVVSYSNRAKEDLLQVNEASIEADGAVSEIVVKQMVAGAVAALRTDFAVAVSGIMGPDGGSDEKPVGTVWIAAGNQQNVITRKFNFRFDRSRNIQLTATNALNLLRQFILEQAL